MNSTTKTTMMTTTAPPATPWKPAIPMTTDARWTKKGKKYCYGYKGAYRRRWGSTGLFLAGHATPRPTARIARNSPPWSSIAKLKKGAPVLADKGYSSADNRSELEKAGYFDLIMYKGCP